MNHLRNAKEGMEEMYRLSSHPDVTKEGQANGNLAIIAHALIAIAEQLEKITRDQLNTLAIDFFNDGYEAGQEDK